MYRGLQPRTADNYFRLLREAEWGDERRGEERKGRGL